MLPDSTCSVEGCERPVSARGWCKSHYARWYKHGDPLHARPSDLERFMKNVAKSGEGCWLWTAILTNGYGKFSDGRRVVKAHRWAYEHLAAPIPDGMDIDHLCRVRNCVNPGHLEAVTHQENVKRGLMPQIMRERHAAVTHCPRGHEYTEQNTYRHTNKKGYVSRSCIICRQTVSRNRIR